MPSILYRGVRCDLPADWKVVETPAGPVVHSPFREPLPVDEAVVLAILITSSSQDRRLAGLERAP